MGNTQNTHLSNDESLEHVHLEDEVLDGEAVDLREGVLEETQDLSAFRCRAMVQPALKLKSITLCYASQCIGFRSFAVT